MKGVAFFLLVLSFWGASAHAASLCDHVRVTHTPREDVTYSPSADVDLNAVSIELGDIDIPLTNYLAEKLELTVPVSSSKLGYVTITQEGRVIYKDKDISDKAETICQNEDKKQDGQGAVEPVKSIPLEPPKEQEIYGAFGQDTINSNYND